MDQIETLSLKYRPKKLGDVIGQPVVVKAFTNAFKSKSLHKSYILAGQYGCGKTTVARIVAAMENCETGWGKDPCGVCGNCRDIFSGNSMEVIERDVASQGGIEDMRNLHKSLYQNPVKCRVKYVIFDEAHRLSGPAAEASLKMIEEPPPFVKFILCTTEPNAFKETIHSRCITWNFHRVAWTDLLNHLKYICEAEKMNCEEKALQIAARFAKGSVRNSLQNLQTMINYAGGEKITEKMAAESIGAVDQKLYSDFIDAVIKCNLSACLKIINRIFGEGRSAKTVIDGFFDHLNTLLIARTCPDSLDSLSYLTNQERVSYTAQANGVQGEIVLKMMSLLHQVSFGISYSLDPDKLFNKFAVEAVMLQKNSKQ